jgi:hypothetical protein
MVAYTWEFGIDWNAVETADAIPESYLRGCLTLNGAPLSGTEGAEKGDTITFKIFDVTPSGTAGVDSIESLEILSTAAVKSQAEAQIHHGLGLEPSQPMPVVITQFDESSETSSAFGPARASWTAKPTVYVTVTAGRFLLTPQVLATGGTGDNVTRLFSMDPEMVVGSNGT